MRLPLTTATLTALGRGLTSDTSTHRRGARPGAAAPLRRTAVLPGRSVAWRPPTRLTGLLDRVAGMTPAPA